MLSPEVAFASPVCWIFTAEKLVLWLFPFGPLENRPVGTEEFSGK